MSKAFGIAFAAAILVIATIVGTALVKTRGNYLAPKGTVGKVRTQKIADDLSLVVIDFSIRNDSERDMIVRSVETQIETPDGKIESGTPIAAQDAVRAFRNFPLLGEQYNEVLKDRDKVLPHQELDRMVAIRFDLPIEQVEKRRRLMFRVEDITGPTMELTK
jgi:hypothetical protein